MPTIFAAQMLKSSSKGRAEMVLVRPGSPADIPRFVEIAAHSVTSAQWSHDRYVQLFAPSPVQPRLTLVIEEDGQVVGFIVGRLIQKECEIENVAVHGSARRRGLGSRLLGEFLDLIRSRGGQEIWLEVRESNLAARTLYERWAFVETGRRKQYYSEPLEDALILKFNFS